MLKNISAALAIITLLTGMLLAPTACSTTETVENTAVTITTPTTTEPVELEPTEVRYYEGERLSSVESSFRDNSIKGPQYIDTAAYTLDITGLVQEPISFTYEEVLNDNGSYKKVVTLNCVEGWDATILWEGVLVRDLLEQAQPTDEATTVIFHAADGYTTSFPISYFTDNDILMAYKMNEIVMPPERGFPFQLVAESKWGYKWIKWITKIELSSNTDYQGYWESRGYADEGNLDEGFFD